MPLVGLGHMQECKNTHGGENFSLACNVIRHISAASIRIFLFLFPLCLCNLSSIAFDNFHSLPSIDICVFYHRFLRNLPEN
jgi:hypothetical protein